MKIMKMRKIHNIKYTKCLYIFVIVILSLFSFEKSYALDEKLSSPKILIFVSSSMPEQSLVQWMQEARELQPHAALIMRGFVHDSLPETRAFMGKIVKDSGGQGGVSIDPALFKKYGIERVPAVVVETPNSENENNANNKKFDVVYGNTSLNQALRVIAEKGETSETVKRFIDNNMREDSHD